MSEAPQPGDILVVIHEFQARSPDELTLSKGDKIEIIENDAEFGDGWFLGRNTITSNAGLFPKVYTRLDPSRPSSQSLKHAHQPDKATIASVKPLQIRKFAAGSKHTEDEDLERISRLWGDVHRVLGPSDDNPFHVCAYLGQGTVGAVEEVTIPKESPKSFVRKKIYLRRAERKEKLKLIQQEVDILKSLTHVHIVRCLGTYEDATQIKRPPIYCLLMSPVGNGDLKAFLDDTPEEPIDDRIIRSGWLQQWFFCLSSALQYMHNQGVRHQDIKPSNIIYRGGSIYLTDFSSSSRFVVGQATSTESPFRTTAMYAAPEVTAKYLEDGTFEKHGRGSDIFALGCVFCEMLTVLAGRSVPSLHEYLVRAGAEDEVNNRSLLYSRKLTTVDQWFQKLDADGLPFVRVYSNCIKPMMTEDRVLRCDAATTKRNFKSPEDFWESAVECSCYEQ